MKFIFPKSYICSACGIAYSEHQTVITYKRNCICDECYKHLHAYSEVGYFDAVNGVEFIAPVFRYNDGFRNLFLDFKFNEDIASGHLLGIAAKQYMARRDDLFEYSHIVPVPVSKKRLRERGYNQTEILAGYISEAMGLPILNVLKRPKHTIPQSKSLRHERIKNVKEAFSTDYDFCDMNVLLFDDVYTTGSTAFECAKVLHNAGADKVGIIVMAYNVPKNIDATVHRFM